MTAVLLPEGKQQFFTTPGVPAVGYKLATFAAGTSTPQTTWSDALQIGANTNPIILDARGEAVIFWNGAYKVQLQDSTGIVIWTVDNVQSSPAPSASLIPIVDNSFTLGSPAFSWANVYVGVSHAPVLDTTTGNIGFIARTAGEIAAGVTPVYFWYPVGNVLRYGALGDGITNNFAAFQQCLAVCKQTGKTMFVPAGNYLLNTTSGTLTLSYVSIQGEGVLDGTSTPAAAGSVLSITNVTNTPFNMRAGVTFKGVGIYYPAQVDSAAPIVFPPTINVDASAGAVNFCYIQNCTIFNAYRFFVATDAAGSIGHIYIDNNSIYGILTCYEIAYNAEIIHWTDNDHTFGLFVSATEGGLRGYTRANGTCLQMTRTDGFTFTGNLMFGYLNGINFPTAGNLCQLMNIIDNVWDNVRFGIVASGTGNLTGMSVSGNSFGCLNSQNTALLGTCILVSTSGAIATETWDIGPNYFGSTTGDLIKVTGNTPTRSLNFSGGIYTSWAAFSATGLFAAFNISGAATAFNVSGAYVLNQGVSTQAAGILGTCSVMNLSGVVFGQCVGAIGLVGIPSAYNFACVTGCTSYGTSGTLANNYSAGSLSDVGNSWDKNAFKSPNVVPIAQYGNYANDAAAAAAGVPIGGQYRNASVVQVRVT